MATRQRTKTFTAKPDSGSWESTITLNSVKKHSVRYDVTVYSQDGDQTFSVYVPNVVLRAIGVNLQQPPRTLTLQVRR